MANRVRGSRFGFGGSRRSQARPLIAGRRSGPGPRARTWLGWAAAAAGLVLVAFFVGRAGSEVGVPSPTPSPSAAPLTVTFGTALDPVTGEAINPTDRFRADDAIAYSVRLPAAPQVDGILVEIVRIDASGETVVQPPSRQGIDATSRIIAFTFGSRTSDLLRDWGPGNYLMRISLPGASGPLANGRFTLVETPAAA